MAAWNPQKSIQVGRGLKTETVHGQVFVTQRKTKKSSRFSVARVRTLPPIPTTGMRMVFWMSATTAPATETLAAGTGDDQVWMAYAGQSRWTELQFFTSLSGLP